MPSTTQPWSPLRSQTLPQMLPLPTASQEIGSTLSSDTSDVVFAASTSTLHLRSQARLDSDRNSIGSVATTLPRYSYINFPAEQAEQHWDLENDINLAGSASLGVDSSPPGYPTFRDLAPPIYAEPSGSPQRSNFVLHKLHVVGGFVVGFRRSSGREPWATMKLLSRKPLPGSKKRLPRFIGGDALKGSVDLRLNAPMNIHSIKLVLKAKAQVEKVSTSYPVVLDHTFLNQSFSIYSKKTTGDPREYGQCDMSNSREFNGSLQGSYSFPFSIPFPTLVEWKYPTQEKALQNTQARQVTTYEIPPSFRENRMTSAVVYELGLVITHGTLKTRSRTTTEIIYSPKKVSPPASEKRQAAYRRATLLPGPSADPDGWHALLAVITRGIYQSRPVTATCILYLAKPLSYTRGTTIPCFLSFSCLDSGFLDALASPHTVNVRLVRKIGHPVQSPAESKEGESIRGRTGAKVHIAKAVWWKPPKTDTPPGLNERHLEGEVHLPKSLVSSCDFPLFTIEYIMEFLPFTLYSFTPAHEPLINGVNRVQEPKSANLEPMIQQVVDITNFHEFGPMPLPFSTQIADDERESEDLLWTNTSGGLGLAETSFTLQGIGMAEAPSF